MRKLSLERFSDFAQEFSVMEKQKKAKRTAGLSG